MKTNGYRFKDKQIMNYLSFITCCIFTCSNFLFSQEKHTNEGLVQPNILWIVSEDNSPFLGCYGDEFATTPVLDAMAKESVLYENAFATAPVCAPARSSLITGMYPSSMGTQHMRSYNAVPELIRFFPKYLRAAGYYCTNNSKEDYNIAKRKNVWDESSNKAHYKKRKEGQPFFAVFNLKISHESNIHKPLDSLIHDSNTVPIPPYHPRTKEMEHDWAQYYDKITMMDTEVGNILKELKDEGLAENTIVFYYSDHGGVLGRSKRYLYESGLRVPLIIRFPKKYKHLAEDKMGSRTDRLVSFVDFAPTVLSLANVEIPDYMQGKAFLGTQMKVPKEYVYGIRGRMDEVIDNMFSVRDKQYRYISNYMPHRVYGQYLEFLWRAPSMASWEKACETGNCNDFQMAFWKTKPSEELYDIEKDPHNIYNLAKKPEYKEVLLRMRDASTNFSLTTKNSNLLPEAEIITRAEELNLTIYEFMQSEILPMARIIETAQMAQKCSPKNLETLIKLMDDPEPTVRYWAVTGCAILGPKAKVAESKLIELLNDASSSVVIAAAESLYYLGEKEKSLKALENALISNQLMVRVNALNVLDLFGEDARPALNSVKALLKDKKSKDRSYDLRAARYFLRKLEGS